MSHAATDAHAESSTYNVDVHKDMWHSRLHALIVRAVSLARLEGAGCGSPSESRRAEDALVAHLSESRTGAAMATLFLLGYTWRGGEQWTAPTVEGRARVWKAAEYLEDQGHVWSDSLGVWLPPAPRREMDAEAVGKLAGMGYRWSGKEWVNTIPAPQGLSAPLGIEIILGPIGGAQRRFAASDPLHLLVRHADMLTDQLRAVHEALQTPGVTGL